MGDDEHTLTPHIYIHRQPRGYLKQDTTKTKGNTATTQQQTKPNENETHETKGNEKY